MGNKVKAWYCEKYPTDECGETLNADVTFADVYGALVEHKDVYKVLGGEADSIVRERVFEELACIKNCEYDDIYNLWLN